MQVSTPASSRAQWYDRNPLAILNTSSLGGVAPHATTTRFTYTVPAGRKALVEVGFVLTERGTAAATAADAGAELVITVGATTAFAVDARVNSNVVGALAELFGGLNLSLLSGNSIAGQDFDASTTGTMTFVQTMKATEFDA